MYIVVRIWNGLPCFLVYDQGLHNVEKNTFLTEPL